MAHYIVPVGGCADLGIVETRNLTETKTLAIRLKESDVAALNQRFRLDGFGNLTELVRAYLNGGAATLFDYGSHRVALATVEGKRNH